MTFFFTKLFIMSTKLTIVASYGTWLQWKTIFCSHPIHGSHKACFLIHTSFGFFALESPNVYIFSPSMNLFLSFHQRNPIGNTKWLEQLWALFQFWGTLRGTNFGLVLVLFGGLIWKFGNFCIFCDDIIMYTSKHQWKKDVESHAYCPKEAFFN